MRNRHFVSILRLALVLTALLFWGVGHGRAQSHQQSHETKTMTDAAGRVHVRRQHNNFAERKAAARERVKKLRKAAMNAPSRGRVLNGPSRVPGNNSVSAQRQQQSREVE